jgi:hypothetical protein
MPDPGVLGLDAQRPLERRGRLLEVTPLALALRLVKQRNDGRIPGRARGRPGARRRLGRH